MTELLGKLFDPPPIPRTAFPHGTKRRCGGTTSGKHRWDIDWSDPSEGDGIDFCWHCDAAYSRRTGKRIKE